LLIGGGNVMVVTQGRVRPTTVHRVVVGVDDSTSSDAALAFAAAMASSLQEEVVPTHVFHAGHGGPETVLLTFADPVLIARETLDCAVERGESALRSVRTVTPELVRGHVAHGLVECSRTAHLLVVGRPGGGGHGTLPDWSIPVHVAKRARCPVAVVPADWHPDEGGAPVSVGLDVPRHGMGILRQAFRVAQAQHRPLQVLHLWRPSSDALHRFPRPRMPEGAADWQLEPSVRRVQDAVGRVAGDFPGVVAHLVVKAEAPGPALEAASRGSALLVVGRHSQGRRSLHGLGTVARHVLRNAASPVLFVDPDGRREDTR
jgi:nucleotide-binding universal stress UspA family protein